MISIGISSGNSRSGDPGGTKKVRKCSPCLTKPRMVTPIKMMIASAKVTTMWLVRVKLYGTMPSRLPNSTNMDAVSTTGKKRRPYDRKRNRMNPRSRPAGLPSGGQGGEDLERDEQRQQQKRGSRWNEEGQEVQPVADEAQDGDADKNDDRQREGDDDVAGEGEAVRDHAEQVAEQHEHEHRQHEGEEAPAFAADGVPDQAGHEFVGEFRRDLPASGNEASAAHAEDQEGRSQDQGDQHEQRRVGEGQIDATDRQRNDGVDFELFERAVGRASCLSHAVPLPALVLPNGPSTAPLSSSTSGIPPNSRSRRARGRYSTCRPRYPGRRRATTSKASCPATRRAERRFPPRPRSRRPTRPRYGRRKPGHLQIGRAHV